MAKAGTCISEGTGITVVAGEREGAEAEAMAYEADTCRSANANLGSPRKSAPETNRRSNNHQISLVFLTSSGVNSNIKSDSASKSKSNCVEKESKSVVSTILATTASTATTAAAAATAAIVAAETNSGKAGNSDDEDCDADCLLEVEEDTFGKQQVISKQSKASRNNSSNNSLNNNKTSSYSKIFRQYLPSSLNLNYTLTNNRGSGKSCQSNSCIQKRPPREIATGENRPTFKSSSSSSASAFSSSPLSPSSLVNAFSFFKLNSSSGKVASTLRRSNEEETKRITSESQPYKDLSSVVHSGNNFEIGISKSPKLICEQGEYNSCENKEEFPRQEIDYPTCQKSNVKVKRKGFLYLKTRSKKGSGPDSGITSTEIHDTSHQKSPILSLDSSQLDKKQITCQSDKQTLRQHLASKRRDLNNNYSLHNYNYNSNSISSLLSSSNSNQYDEHKACLLEEDSEGEEDKGFNQNKKGKVHNNKCQLARLEVREVNQTDKNDNKMSQNTSARQANGRNYVHSRSNIKQEITSSLNMKSNKKRDNSKQLLIVTSGCLLTIFASLILTQGKLTLAQLQSSAPFSRSQQSSPVSLNQPLSSQAVSPVVSGLPGSPNSIPVVGNSINRGPPSSSSSQLPPPQPAAGSLVANINCNKIRGHVTLTPNIRGAGTTVTTQISAGPPGEVYQWSIHQFPVKPGASMCSCSPLILGTKLIDLSEMHGNLPSDQEFNVQSSLNLFGFDSPVGHSLMLRGMKTGMVACATFLPTRKSNYRAKFHTPISGSVTIFQTAFGTSFISHLMYSNGTRRHSQHRFDLVKSEDDIVTTSLLSGVQAGSAGGSTSGGNRIVESFALLEQREHDNELSQCKRFNNGEALLRNMTYQLAVSTENFGMRGRTSMVLPQIPFETFSSVYIIVYSEHDPSEPIACAPLKFVKPKTAAAKFQSVSVQGSVVFSQDSPYDVTIARINLNMPNSDGHSYGIDELPMIIRRKSDTRVCPNIREIIYNPHHVEPSSVPLEGEATSDQYAVGDLSGKYGSLTGKSSEKIQVNDYNLPLFGPISIVGRAMTIYSAEGVAIACSNVELTTPMTTAFATFDYGIQGQFIFRQPINDCNGDTYVYIEVSKPVSAGTTSTNSNNNEFRSLDHNWHIHLNPVDSGLDHLSTTDCLPAGPHYNPYNTSTSNIYSRDCTPFNVLRCELGDLSAKMFTIDIPPYRVKGGQEPDIGKFFGTDIDLPLCGPVSVVNRSVVVHVQDFGSQRLACSTVIEFKPRAS